MLRVTQQDSSAAAKRYYSRADYLSEGQELIGLWGGRGARRLGLEGTVDRDAFERLCDNLHPHLGDPLTARTRTERTVGYDFTFSVPKSVSLLHALTGDAEILGAFRAAVDDTMRDVETEMKTRVRKERRDEDRVTGNMVWAEFVHTTSRPVGGVPDPQLHAHVFAFNATFDDHERQWKAGQFRDLKRDAPYFQAAFRVRLANRLQNLGFEVERKRDDFELSGLPAGVLKRFSRRTTLIEQVAADRGITDPKLKDALGAETRENKSKALDSFALRRTWDSELTHTERQALAAVHRREEPVTRFAPGETMAVDYALEHTFTRESVAPQRKLLTEALKRGIGSVTVEGVRQELARRPLILGEYAGRVLATVRDAITAEARLVAFAQKGRGKFRPLGDPDRPLTRTWLNEGQAAAVRHVLGSRDRVTVVRGAAGVGKTTLEQEIGEALTGAGVRVVALAPSAAASRGVLRSEAGFATADTVARFQVDEGMQAAAKNGVVLVDEASLLGVRDMLRLFETADRLGARLVLVGDRRQHRAVLAGEPLKLLERAGVPVAAVTEIMRQSGDYKNATLALSEGRLSDGFDELKRLGWIREVADADRYQQLAQAYIATVQERKRNGDPKTALVVSPTHAEAARVTQAIREQLKARGQLGEERTVAAWAPGHLSDPQKADPAQYEPGVMLRWHQNAPGHVKGTRQVLAAGDALPLRYADRFELYRPFQLRLAVGDRVRITAGGTTRDGKHGLATGAIYTVRGFTRGGDLVIDHGWQIGRDFGCLDYGFCTTSMSAQGRTVDRVFIGQSAESFPASNRRQFYVSVSRGKEQAVIFTDDAAALRAAVNRADEPLSATEFLQARRVPPRRFKHLAFLRRLDTFARTHESRSRTESRTVQQEARHDR